MKTRKVIKCGFWILLVFALSNLNSATFLVTNTNIAGPGSLRDAMIQANSTAGPDSITFNIPGAGPHTIFPNSPLPDLVDPAGVVIDGLSQPGAAPGTNPPSTAVLMIEINGTNTGPTHGFRILSPYNTIRGLVINNFQWDGICIEGVPGGTYNNYIYCNFIGVDPTGTVAQGNGHDRTSLWAGVYILVPVNPQSTCTASHNTVEANLISSNYAEGVGIASCPPGDVFENVVCNNYVGTDITGTLDLGNAHDGVYIGEKARDNEVSYNLISGNDYSGVGIVGYYDPWTQWNTRNNRVLHNVIGMTIDSTPLANSREGICIGQYGTGRWGYASNNTIGPGNMIAYNGRNGVLIWENEANTVNADSNSITQNSIYDNSLLGIDLCDDSVTPNDTNDPDAGPNQVLNFPVINSAVFNAGQTTISGTIEIDTNPAQAVVEVFKARPDPTGFGEGEVFLNAATPDGTGNWTVVVASLVAGDYVTATTTDASSNTSEFCENVTVTWAAGVEDENLAGIPVMYSLSQNYPNPFNAETVLFYRLPLAGNVELDVCNALGEKVRVLADGRKNAGVYCVSWDGMDASGRAVPSGVYFYRIKAGSFSRVRKALLIR